MLNLVELVSFHHCFKSKIMWKAPDLNFYVCIRSVDAMPGDRPHWDEAAGRLWRETGGFVAEGVMRIEYLKGINNGPYKGSYQILIVQFF